MKAYVLLVGVPILCLFGIIEMGRGVVAPLSVGGEWTVQFDPAANCATGFGRLRQAALSISQSGRSALITLNDGRVMTFPATITGNNMSAALLRATIAGKPGDRFLQGNFDFDGCAPVAFRAIRHPPVKKGE